MSDAKWNEIARLRQSGTTDARRIRELLDELAGQDDIDAIVQKELEALDGRVHAGELKECEAFAEAMASIARAVENQPAPRTASGPRNWTTEKRFEFLQLAWAYLISHQEHTDFGFVSVEVMKREPKGAYEDAAPSWTTTHNDAPVGSGYMPPRDDDPDQDRSGRKAHFIGNAIATYKFGLAGEAPRVGWDLSESSTTDIDVNKIGSEFGHRLTIGEIDSANIAGWIKSKLCTEGQCAPGQVNAALRTKLAWAVATGTFTYHYEGKGGSRDPSAPIPPRERESYYVRDENLRFSFRVSVRGHSAKFGRVVDGTWNTTHRETVTKDGAREERAVSLKNALPGVEGEMALEGDEDYIGTYYVMFLPPELTDEDRKRIDDAKIDTSARIFGRPEGRLCADGTLSGSGSGRIGADTWYPVEVAASIGGVLRGDDMKTAYRKKYHRANWSWRITFQAVAPPDHAGACAELTEAGAVFRAVDDYLVAVGNALASAYVDMYRTGRTAEVMALATAVALTPSSLEIERQRLHELENSMRSMCASMDDMWLSTDPLADSEYKRIRAEFQDIAKQWDESLLSIGRGLGGRTRELASTVEADAPAAAAKLNEMARTMEQHGPLFISWH